MRFFCYTHLKCFRIIWLPTAKLRIFSEKKYYCPLNIIESPSAFQTLLQQRHYRNVYITPSITHKRNLREPFTGMRRYVLFFMEQISL